MTETAYIQAMRDEVDIADLFDLPYKEHHTNGFSVNTDSASEATEELILAGKDYRVQVWATNDDGDRYPVAMNAGVDNGIGADGLVDKMEREELSLPEFIEVYTDGLVRKDDIAFYQLEFYQEQHRGK